jgi:hypothetical protein
MKNEQINLVEIAGFTYPSEAQVLISLLESEGIECFLKDEFMSEILPGLSDIGNVRLQVKEEDMEKALKIMEEGGFGKYIEE